MVMSTTHPGHSERNPTKSGQGGKMRIVEIPQPVAVGIYNCYMASLFFLGAEQSLRMTTAMNLSYK